jgi:hypothetical protein
MKGPADAVLRRGKVKTPRPGPGADAGDKRRHD